MPSPTTPPVVGYYVEPHVLADLRLVLKAVSIRGAITDKLVEKVAGIIAAIEAEPITEAHPEKPLAGSALENVKLRQQLAEMTEFANRLLKPDGVTLIPNGRKG